MLILRKISIFGGRRPLSSFLRLSEENEKVQKDCRIFAETELMQVAAENDKLARFPKEQIEQLGRKGLMSACIDKKYGGSGYTLLTLTLAVEELSRCCASTGIIVSIHNCLYAELVQTFGTKQQIAEFLLPLTKGDIGVFALSEQDAGSDAANLTTQAVSNGDWYILNGRKAWVTSGYEAKAGVFFAVTNITKNHHGISAFLIPLDAPGIELGKREEKLGIRASSTCDIILNNVRVPKENLIGSPGAGFKIAMQQLQLGRIGVAAQAIGIGRGAFDLAVKYARKRTVLGEKLADKQLVKAKLSEMATELEVARLLLWKAAALKDAGGDFRKLSSMAKLAASQCATNNSHNCVQIMGAKGFISGNAERFYRDSRITQIYGGATDIQKMVIADLVIKEAATIEDNLD